MPDAGLRADQAWHRPQIGKTEPYRADARVPKPVVADRADGEDEGHVEPGLGQRARRIDRDVLGPAFRQAEIGDHHGAFQSGLAAVGQRRANVGIWNSIEHGAVFGDLVPSPVSRTMPSKWLIFGEANVHDRTMPRGQ